MPAHSIALDGSPPYSPALRRSADTAREALWSAMMGAAQRGDKQAYEQLLRTIFPHVCALIRRRGFAGRESETEDIAQDVLLSLHLVRHTYDPERPFAPWLAGIVRHRIIDHHRKNRRRRHHEIAFDRLPDSPGIPSPSRPQDDRDELADLLGALTALPPGQRKAFELVKLRGLSLAQAAAESGMSIAALKIAAHRAIKCLRLSLACEAPSGHQGACQ